MARAKKLDSASKPNRPRPALTPEAREQQLVASAINLAEKQILEGTASSQIITHYLKLGTAKNQLELEKLRHETELLKAKKEALESARHTEELYQNAIKAMRSYAGVGSDDEDY